MAKAHIESLALLEKSCFSTPWTEDGLREELCDPQSHFLVAADGEQTAGYIGVQEICGTAYVTNVAVSPSYRRQGIGRALVQAAADGARMRQCAEITLEVRESNAPAIALYTQCGFVPVGRRRAFYREPTEDALIYTRFFEENNV